MFEYNINYIDMEDMYFSDIIFFTNKIKEREKANYSIELLKLRMIVFSIHAEPEKVLEMIEKLGKNFV